MKRRARRKSLAGFASRGYDARVVLKLTARPEPITLRLSQPMRREAAASAARTALAALLALATLAAATRADSILSAPDPAMDCCKGVGGATKDSCPLARLKAARRTALRVPEESRDPICRARATSFTQPASRLLAPRVAAARSQREASPRPAPPPGSPSTSAASPAASHPCPFDCCCRVNSATRAPRPRDEAAFNDQLRARPPTRTIRRRAARPVSFAGAQARGLLPARAPPASL